MTPDGLKDREPTVEGGRSPKKLVHPDGWVRRTIADIGKVVTGSTPSTKNETFWNGTIPFVTPADLGSMKLISKTDRHVTEEGLARVKEIPSGAVMVTCIASIGKLGISKERCCTNQQINSVIPNDLILSEYLYYALSFTSDVLIRLAGTTAVPIVNKSKFLSLDFLVPRVPEQRKISAILSSVDDAIERTQAVIDQVQVVKRGLMQELLTQGLPGRHTRFKQTEVGEIPEDWNARTIEALVISCDYGTSDALTVDEIGLPVLRMGNLQDGGVSLEDLKYIAAEKVPDELLLSEGDVLFNRTNSADLVGKVAVFEHQRKVSFASYLLRLRVEPRQGNGYWLSYLLNTPELQKKLRSTATPGVSQVNISRRSLLATVVPVPSVEEQATIVSMLDSIEHSIPSGCIKTGLFSSPDGTLSLAAPSENGVFDTVTP